MIIKCDEQGHEAVKQLCDIALKMGGMTNLQGVVTILQSLKLERPEEVKPAE